MMSSVTDVAGNARVTNGAPDIGAYKLNTNAPLLRVHAALTDLQELVTYNFGTVWIDTTQNRTLIIRNVGGSVLTGNVALTPGPLRCISATNYVVAVNDNNSLVFSFTPLTSIVYTATTTFIAGGDASVLLRGTSEIPEPATLATLVVLAVLTRVRHSRD